MSGYLTVSDVARELGGRFGVVIRPRDVSDLFYTRVLEDASCPILGGRRVIAREFLPEIERVLLERGILHDVEMSGP